MAERLLCDDVAKVTVSGSGDRLLLAVKGSTSVRFWASTTDLDEAIETGTPLQISVHDGFCRLVVGGERVHLDFAVGDSGRRACDFPLDDLRAAIEMVRLQ